MSLFRKLLPFLFKEKAQEKSSSGSTARTQSGGGKQGSTGPRKETFRAPKQDREERSERGSNNERGERSERGNRGERGERNRGERGERNGRSERGERNDRGERGERFERNDRSERGERQDRGERRENQEGGERPEREMREPGPIVGYAIIAKCKNHRGIRKGSKVYVRQIMEDDERLRVRGTSPSGKKITLSVNRHALMDFESEGVPEHLAHHYSPDSIFTEEHEAKVKAEVLGKR